ncbi:MAG: isopentenyl-diphosphate delta-isomerase, partial [Euryarchaeota archaeon]|nr:isopentenyl-diphosphate delta-isomerase [Euryarchaeota archaeon]
MAGYQIEDVPSMNIDDEFKQILQDSSADLEQINLMSEAIIGVDESDNEVRAVSKVEAHHSSGILHRAFSVLLFDSNNRLLLQKRASHKVTFPNVWANSCCSHPLYSESERELGDALGVKRAAIRKLNQELGISESQVPISDFSFMTKMVYSSRMNEEWIEREIDHILVIKADVDVNINENEVSDIKWVSQEELEAMLVAEVEGDGEIAPWFRCIASRLMTEEWWDAIGDKEKLGNLSDDLIHDMGD